MRHAVLALFLVVTFPFGFAPLIAIAVRRDLGVAWDSYSEFLAAALVGEPLRAGADHPATKS